MKGLLTVLAFILVLPSLGQPAEYLDRIKQLVNRKKNAVYMFCRGTKSKSSMIARRFNLVDTCSTHVGLGIVSGKRLVIYNVTDQYADYSGAMVLDSLESFTDLPDLYYLAVWKCDLSRKEYKRVKEICTGYSRNRICFDASFILSDDDTLYCSEFCALVLNQLGLPDLSFSPATVLLNNMLLESVLERNTLTYFPVDFFRSNKRFRKIFEKKIGE